MSVSELMRGGLVPSFLSPVTSSLLGDEGMRETPKGKLNVSNWHVALRQRKNAHHMPETIVVLVHLHPHVRDYWLRFAKTLAAIPTRFQFLREQIAPSLGVGRGRNPPMTTTKTTHLMDARATSDELLWMVLIVMLQ